MLVHESEAAAFLPRLAEASREASVEVRGCASSRALVPSFAVATEADFGREFLDLILAVRVVPSLDAAIQHIERYGSMHTESICTCDAARASRFLHEVTASCVLVNASTRFNDGGELGLGAEIGISTSKVHAFGPMGLSSLTTKKWIVYGAGQTRG